MHTVSEAIDLIRPKLPEYLAEQLGITDFDKPFRCFVHEDSTPSMVLWKKTNNEVAKCFGCGAKIDIFKAASILEGLPDSGPEWLSTTVEHLAEKFGIKYMKATNSPLAKEKAKLYSLVADIANTLEQSKINREYIEERNWNNEYLDISSIDTNDLIDIMLEKGWSLNELEAYPIIKSSHRTLIDSNKITFTIRDIRKRAIGFVSRSIDNSSPKYVNTGDTLIFSKSKTLVGLDVAITAGKARQNGIFVVEGPGDLAQLYRLDITNAVAVCGTAFNSNHINMLQNAGITKLFLCLDWDSAGSIATANLLKKEAELLSQMTVYVVNKPDGLNISDVDELLRNETSADAFEALEHVPAFEWMLQNTSKNKDATEICTEMMSIIAMHSSAVKRDTLIQMLSNATGITYQSIMMDVNSLRDKKAHERRERLLAAAQRYIQNLEEAPDNIDTLLAQHEEDVILIENDYNKQTVGRNYQLSRYEALQKKREVDANGGHSMEFFMGKYTLFAQAMSGGMDWTSGVLIYVGGRPNSGKTATVVSLAADIALHDRDAIVLAHFTDDNYLQIEPRFKSNIAEFLRDYNEPKLSIGMLVNPYKHCPTDKHLELYHRADDKFKELILEERLILIDSEDGSTLTPLEKNLRYIRSKYPDKKLLVVCDNTHNYCDFANLEQNTRMRLISARQADLTTKYKCSMIATVEYRKNMPLNTSRMKLPVNDDIADARALMYRPNAIIHVYNDLNDRQEDAEIFWLKDGVKQPRLMLLFSKNKISSFKDKLMMDLDIESVTLNQIDKEVAYQEFLAHKEEEEEEDDGYNIRNQTLYYKANADY